MHLFGSRVFANVILNLETRSSGFRLGSTASGKGSQRRKDIQKYTEGKALYDGSRDWSYTV
jgi:hypothetical protein